MINHSKSFSGIFHVLAKFGFLGEGAPGSAVFFQLARFSTFWHVSSCLEFFFGRIRKGDKNTLQGVALCGKNGTGQPESSMTRKWAN
jgi:hypothetical protein